MTSRSSRFPPVLLWDWWKCQLPDSKGPLWRIILCRLTGPDAGWLWSAFLRPRAASEHNGARSWWGSSGPRLFPAEGLERLALRRSGGLWPLLKLNVGARSCCSMFAAAERAAQSCREQSCQTLLNTAEGFSRCLLWSGQKRLDYI